jgi:hypothetical protein
LIHAIRLGSEKRFLLLLLFFVPASLLFFLAAALFVLPHLLQKLFPPINNRGTPRKRRTTRLYPALIATKAFRIKRKAFALRTKPTTNIFTGTYIKVGRIAVRLRIEPSTASILEAAAPVPRVSRIAVSAVISSGVP